MVRGRGVTSTCWGLWTFGALSLAVLCLSDQAIRCPVCSKRGWPAAVCPMVAKKQCANLAAAAAPPVLFLKGHTVVCTRPDVALASDATRHGGVERPLHSLMHGQGICTDEREVEENSAVDRQEEVIPEHPNNSNIRCSPQDKRCIQKTMARHPLKTTNLRSNSAREETKPVLAPCRAELQRALDRLASNSRTHDDLFTIPIPNCDKNGDFHPKQCHPARDGHRGKCWCVDPKTGMRLPGPLELRGDLDCHQLMTATLRD